MEDLKMSNFPRYDTKLFTEVWEDVNAFKTDYNGVGIPTTISATNASTLYYLLYARYGNSPIANYDENQFKYKVFSTIYQYGPTWEKRLAIQQNIRGLTDTDLLKGSEAIYNHAYNPSQEPAVDSRTPLNYINDQNATLYNKSKMDAYGQLWDLLATDVTGEFLDKFKGCFKQFVTPERTWIYVTELDEEEDNG